MNFKRISAGILLAGFFNVAVTAMYRPNPPDITIELLNNSAETIVYRDVSKSMDASRDEKLLPAKKVLLSHYLDGNICICGKKILDDYYVQYAKMPDSKIGIIGLYMRDLDDSRAMPLPQYFIEQHEQLLVTINAGRIIQFNKIPKP